MKRRWQDIFLSKVVDNYEEKKKLGFEPDWLLKIESLIDSVIFMKSLFKGTVDSTQRK